MPYKILIVDDNAQLRGVLKKYLQNFLNCEIFVSPDGFAATKFLEAEKPALDAVVLDVMMRSHGGSVASYRISDPQYKDTMLVFYTGLQRHQVDKKILGDAWFVHKSKGSLMEVVSLMSKELKKNGKAGPAAGVEVLHGVESDAGGM